MNDSKYLKLVINYSVQKHFLIFKHLKLSSSHEIQLKAMERYHINIILRASNRLRTDNLIPEIFASKIINFPL